MRKVTFCLKDAGEHTYVGTKMCFDVKQGCLYITAPMYSVETDHNGSDILVAIDELSSKPSLTTLIIPLTQIDGIITFIETNEGVVLTDDGYAYRLIPVPQDS